jgi:hypothetical protein
MCSKQTIKKRKEIAVEEIKKKRVILLQVLFLLIQFKSFLLCFRTCPKGKTWYLVKWLGFKKPTWTYYKHCEGCADLIRIFMEG